MNKKLLIAAILAIVASYAGLRQPEHKPAYAPQQPGSASASRSSADSTPAIDQLTAESRVAGYLQQHQRLPAYYIRKTQARKAGWDPAKGNLCDVLPGQAIGGDRFSNREGGLPEKSGRQWYEADVNYQCGRRGADRLLYSSDGLIYVTRDHYRHFEQVH